MAINLKSYLFEGLYKDPALLQSQSGVYAILGRNPVDLDWTVLDLGESGDVREQVSCHDRREDWSRQSKKELACAAYYCSEVLRVRVEQELRDHFNPPCGEC